MKELKIDSEFKNLVPTISDVEFAQLEDSIKTEGCRDALVVWKDRSILLDGHNRYKICSQHGIDFHIEELQFEDRNSATMWIIKTHFARRNLSSFGRCELALKLKPLLAEEAKEHQRLSKGRGKKGLIKKVNLIDTEKEIAKIAGLSKGTINKVDYISVNGNEKEIGRARTGEWSIHRVYKEVKSRLVREERDRKVAEMVKKQEEEEAKIAKGEVPETTAKYWTDEFGNKCYEIRHPCWIEGGIKEYDPEYKKAMDGELKGHQWYEVWENMKAIEDADKAIKWCVANAQMLKDSYKFDYDAKNLNEAKKYYYPEFIKLVKKLKKTIAENLDEGE